ncbi:MAG: O-antigen ligase family protein [Gammaproteobacteria bacterium]
MTRDAGSPDHAHAALILCAFALLATENLVHYPVALMSLLGLVRLARAPRATLFGPGAPLTLVFLALWLPMLAALPDAVNAARAHKTVWLYLHFLPLGWYLMAVCGRPTVYRLVTQGVVALVLFVAIDALVQLIWGQDLFGYPYDGKVLKGVFHPKQRIGLILAVFAPLCLDVVRQWCRHFPGLWMTLIPLAIVVAMSLKRTAWVMLAVGGIVYLWLRHHRDGDGRSRGFVARLVVVLAAVGALALLNPSLKRQLETTAGLFSADPALIDRATSYRVTLWRTGLDVFAANWLNGVGPRGYREAYADFAAEDDFWIRRGVQGQTHPHLLVLEVAVETGIIGLAGLLLAYGVLLRAFVRARDGPVAPLWLLCALVAWFPLNAHLAFYGSYWATLAWLTVGIGLAAAAVAER